MQVAAAAWRRGGGDPLALLRLPPDEYEIALAVIAEAVHQEREVSHG